MSSNAFYKYIVLTNKAYEYQSRVIAGETMQFTRIDVGDGKVLEGEDLSNMTEIKHKVTTGDIMSITPDGHMVKISGVIKSEGLTEATPYREIGIYAQIDDEEILYAYINSDDKFDYIVPLVGQGQRDYSTNMFNLHIVVGNSANIDITLDNNVIVDNSININMLDDSVKEYIDQRITELIKEQVPELPSINNSKFDLVEGEEEDTYIGLIRDGNLEDHEGDYILDLS